MEKPRLEPTEVLHVCKTQVAELELWLRQANVAFEPETLDADMQQAVEQQLVGCQVRLGSEFMAYLFANPLPRLGDFLLKQQWVSSCYSDPYVYLGLNFCSHGNFLKQFM